ncbi:unnamed protein product [Symbiodinium natans]|uniref:Uncharacterized protein n=1 Tax=Symbiodinium natans TaxID=878477 RepID=A0A812GCT2_9DINO|nr:unnamed protein product [Symbiodinium natans]
MQSRGSGRTGDEEGGGKHPLRCNGDEATPPRDYAAAAEEHGGAHRGMNAGSARATSRRKATASVRQAVADDLDVARVVDSRQKVTRDSPAYYRHGQRHPRRAVSEMQELRTSHMPGGR